MGTINKNMVATNQTLSIVVPCYNEAEVIDATLTRLLAVSDMLQDMRTEIICVDDGSHDATLLKLQDWCARDDRIHAISLSRNFGHQLAATAGLQEASGDAIVLIDADLQDPPEMIPDMLARWREGFDVVYAVRDTRAGESLFKRWSASLFYRLLDRLSDVRIPLDTGDFRLMSRRVVDILNQMPEKDRFLRGMVSWVGMHQTPIHYQRPERQAGTTKYSLMKMLRLAADGLFSFSMRPLQVSIGLGMLTAGLALIGIIYAMAMRLFTHNWVTGWTALMISVLFMGGIQLLCIGIMGEYIGRIYRTSKDRPLYLVKSRHGTPRPAPANTDL